MPGSGFKCHKISNKSLCSSAEFSQATNKTLFGISFKKIRISHTELFWFIADLNMKTKILRDVDDKIRCLECTYLWVVFTCLCNLLNIIQLEKHYHLGTNLSKFSYNDTRTTSIEIFLVSLLLTPNRYLLTGLFIKDYFLLLTMLLSSEPI